MKKPKKKAKAPVKGKAKVPVPGAKKGKKPSPFKTDQARDRSDKEQGGGNSDY